MLSTLNVSKCHGVEVENINLIQDSDYVTIEHTNLFPNHVVLLREFDGL